MDIKNIHSGHRKRVKENVIKNGFSQLEEHKLLELMLFYSIPREDTNELAHKLINHFGSFEEVFKADVDQLKRVDGVGDNTAIMIAAMGETFSRISKAKPPKKRVYKTAGYIFQRPAERSVPPDWTDISGLPGRWHHWAG